MRIRLSTLTLAKRYPLTISRGTSTGTENLLVEVEHEGITGLGEMAPVNIGDEPETAETGRRDLERWSPALEPLAPWEMQRTESLLDEMGGGRAARAALDMAFHDWLGKRAGLPLYRLLGGDLARVAPTSLTIGINAPEVVRERVREIVERLNPLALKIKLGSPAGIEADRAMFEAARESAPAGMRLRVD